jgi:putative Holliday junction resolvase
MKYLGIDYGTKRTGIAISDETLTVAFPYKTIQTSKELANDILEIIKAEQIVKVAIGESKDKDMKDNPVMKHINVLKKELEEKGVEVDFHPEMYSSAQVVSIMGEENKSIDASAAAVILQNYLDLQKHI